MFKSNGKAKHKSNGKAKSNGKPKSRIETIGDPPPEDSTEAGQAEEASKGPLVLAQLSDGTFGTVEEALAEKAADKTAPEPEQLPEHVRQHYDAILVKEQEVAALESEYLADKERATDSKKAFDAADKALRHLIARGPVVPVPPPKFPKRIKLTQDVRTDTMPVVTLAAGTEYDAIVAQGGAVSVDAGDDGLIGVKPGEYEVLEWTEGLPANPEAEAVSEAWRAAPLDALGLPDKITRPLIEAGIETVGQVEDLRAGVADRQREWPKGIGEVAAGTITETQLDWLQENRETYGVPEAETAAV